MKNYNVSHPLLRPCESLSASEESGKQPHHKCSLSSDDDDQYEDDDDDEEDFQFVGLMLPVENKHSSLHVHACINVRYIPITHPVFSSRVRVQ